MGTGALFPGGKAAPPTGAEVKETWIYTSTPPPPIRLLGLVFNKLNSGNFFTFTQMNIGLKLLK
jgi:hypothetical protein